MRRPPIPTISSARVIPGLAVILALVASLAVTWGTTSLSAAEPTDSAADLQRGALVAGTHAHGRILRGQWFGTWRFGSRTGFCIEFDRYHPNSTSIKHAPSTLPRFTSAASKRAKYVIANYGTTRNSDVAASAAIAVWKLQNTARFNRYYKKMIKAKAIPRRIQTRAAAILRESLNYGPYKLSMTMSSALPGQVVRGTVTVRAANNKVMAGKAVALIATNARILTRTARSNASGVIAFTARVAGAVR